MMKIVVVALCLIAFVVAQDPCESYDTEWTNCIVAAYEKGACTGTSWCDICSSLFQDYANCTCAESLSFKPACIPDCVDLELCSAESAYNTSISCTPEQTAYTNCLVGGKRQANINYAAAGKQLSNKITLKVTDLLKQLN